jgi:hypothetical protein
VYGFLVIYLLYSLPFLNIHVVLGGYAELWLAASLALAVISWLQWREEANWRQLVLCLLMLLMGLMAKRSSVPWIMVFIVVAIMDRLPRSISLTSFLIAGSAAIILFWIGGISLDIPGLGLFELSSQHVRMPMLVDQQWSFTNISGVLLSSLFFSTNWHLFWYLFLAAILLGLCRGYSTVRDPGPLLLILGWTLVFSLIFYCIPRYSKEALNLTTLNRGIVQLVPSVLVVLAWWYRYLWLNSLHEAPASN